MKNQKVAPKPDYKFSAEYFAKNMDCETLPLNPRTSGLLNALIDHGFIADRACIWGGEEFDGIEYAVVSRTYSPDDDIDNPPEGLTCVRLNPKGVMGADDLGQAVATFISGPGEGAEELLNLMKNIPVSSIPYALAYDMTHEFYIQILPDYENSCVLHIKMRKSV